jgi:hypothetical protein
MVYFVRLYRGFPIRGFFRPDLSHEPARRAVLIACTVKVSLKIFQNTGVRLENIASFSSFSFLRVQPLWMHIILLLYSTCCSMWRFKDKLRGSGVGGWDLAEWLERCASIPKITGSNPSGSSEFTFRSDFQHAQVVIKHHAYKMHLMFVGPQQMH